MYCLTAALGIRPDYQWAPIWPTPLYTHTHMARRPMPEPNAVCQSLLERSEPGKKRTDRGRMLKQASIPVKVSPGEIVPRRRLLPFNTACTCSEVRPNWQVNGSGNSLRGSTASLGRLAGNCALQQDLAVDTWVRVQLVLKTTSLQALFWQGLCWIRAELAETHELRWTHIHVLS